MRNLKERATRVVNEVLAIVVTDSKGAYDAVNQLEGANLGLRRSRTAIEAAALKQSFDSERSLLVWLASDWNLGDGLTKEKIEARRSLESFLRTGRWRLRFDPNFIVAARKAAMSARETMRREPGTGDKLGNFMG